MIIKVLTEFSSHKTYSPTDASECNVDNTPQLNAFNE